MELGLFMQPVHRAEKPWATALAEDRESVLLAEKLGFSEVWIGEHFSTKAEQIPSPLMFLASLIEQTSTIRFATGVINLPYHHPVIVAAETAQFDQMSGGRLILGFGPGGLMSDAELFGMEDMPERYRVAMESIDIILALWNADAPLRFDGEHFPMTLERRVWLSHGVGRMAQTFQKPHPPVALAMVGPGGQTAETIAERDFIPISANFVPVSNLVAQWQSYAQTRERLGKIADPSIWRVCRNVLVTDSDAQAEEILADPDGTFAYYYRYIRGVRQIEEFREHQDKPLLELNALLEVDVALEESVIAGSLASVQERLVDLVDQLGPFGTLVMVGQDWDDAVMWPTSMRRLAKEVIPVLTQHADQLK